MASISRVIGNRFWTQIAGWVFLASRAAWAQVPPPPPAAAPASSKDDLGVAGGDALDANPELEPTQRKTSAKTKKTREPAAASPAPAAPEAAPAGETATESTESGETEADGEEAAAETDASAVPGESLALSPADQLRAQQNRAAVSLQGSTGLLRIHSPSSGPVGSFRIGLLGSYFSTSGFLCPSCESPTGETASTPDQVRRVEAHVMLGITPLPFLEVYGAFHSSATSNNRGTPKLLQVLGDSAWGVKGFMPYEEDRIFSAGAALEAWLLNGAGSVGISGTSIALRALGSADFTNRHSAAERLPLRVNANLSYIFDNSAALIADVEKSRNRPISRLERFGLNVNRLDRLSIGLGVEGVFTYVNPFAEFSIDLPVNRQGYECLPRKLGASDVCLSQNERASSVPSRLSLGARGYVPVDGLQVLAALDVGLGGVNGPFWVETQPEMPWNLWLGLTYSGDTKPKVMVKTVQLPAPEQAEVAPGLPTAKGVVVDGATGGGVPGAILRFEGRTLTGMVANESGEFVTPPMTPGKYTLAVTHDDYESASCVLTVEAEAAAAEAAAPATAELAKPEEDAAPAAPPPAAPPAAGAGQASASGGARCELKAKAKVGNVEGNVVDANSLRPLAGALITVTDPLGRSLSLEADERGAFRFENVLPGKVVLRVEADKHLPTAAVVTVVSRRDVGVQVPAHALPATPNLSIAADQIRLKRPLRFTEGGSELLPESRALLDEVASFLGAHPELKSVEIRVFAGDRAGLSAERATSLRNDLLARGVAAERVQVPSSADVKRPAGDRSERVEFVVVK